jgi:hypothetical protein
MYQETARRVVVRTSKESNCAPPRATLSVRHTHGPVFPPSSWDWRPRSTISQTVTIRLGADLAREGGAVTDTRSLLRRMVERTSWTLRCVENRSMGIRQNDIPATGPYREECGVRLPARTTHPEPIARPASRITEMAASTDHP